MVFRYSCGHAEKEAEVRSVCETVHNARILQFEPRRELAVPCIPCFGKTTHEDRLKLLARLANYLPDLFLDFFWLLVLIEDQLSLESNLSTVRMLDTWTKHVRDHFTYRAEPILAIDHYVRRHHGLTVYLDVHATLNAQSVTHKSMEAAEFDALHGALAQAASEADAIMPEQGDRRRRPHKAQPLALRDAARKVGKAAALYAAALTGPPRESHVHARQLRSAVHWEQAPMYEWLMDTVVELCRRTEAAGLRVKAEIHSLGRLAAEPPDKGAALAPPWKATLEALKVAADDAVPWYREKAKQWKMWRAYARKWDERIENPMRFDFGRTKLLYDRAMKTGEDARTRRRERGAESEEWATGSTEE